MGFEMKITGGDGRRYDSLADMVRTEGSRLIDDHVHTVERAIQAQRCHVHGQRASVTVKQIGDEITFDIGGCCDDLVQRAQAAASRVQ